MDPDEPPSMGATDEVLADALYRAMESATRTEFTLVEPPDEDDYPIVIDGRFKWKDIARSLRRELYSVGLEIVAASKAEKI